DDETLNVISYKQAVLIGIFQALAVIPGVSRSAATIMGGLSLRISRKNIVEFSFLLALPTMLAATVFDLYKSPPAFSQNEIVVWIIGITVSFITALLGIKFFLKFIQKHDFAPFGWYRIIIGLIVIAYLFI
ncbi:MAG TPA: undecaprenyl-diphosphate phosphatase, partial [Patescibacteria group bacterium]|nr:undecaprenyl-diphosphate phosphatase [Patescibacteria group bacterium]